MRGGDRPRRPAARAPDQAARPGPARHPAAPRCLAAVARGVEQPPAAVHGGGPDTLGGDGRLGPRGAEPAALRGPGSRGPRRLGRPDRRAVGTGPRPAPPLRPRRGDRPRPARSHDRRRHRRRRPGAGADPRRLADRQAFGRHVAAVAHRPAGAGAHHPPDRLPAGGRAHRRGAVAAPAGLAGPALHRRERAPAVAFPAPADGGGPHRRLHLCRADARRREPRGPPGDGRPGARHHHRAAHPAGARHARLACRAARRLGAAHRDRRHLVVDRAPAAHRAGAVGHRPGADRLRHPGRPPSQRDLHELPADRGRASPASRGRRPARGRGRARHAAGQVGAPPLRPAARRRPCAASIS